jgi:RNA polymerase sigma factor (sigma-70 family)
MLNAREVVAKCLKNQAAAQKQLYEAYAPQMLAICYRYTKSSAEASDVMQEGFVRVFTNLHQWKGEGEIGAWIRRIMVNTALNWLRDHRNMQWSDDRNIPENQYTQAVITPLENLEARELADLIRKLPTGYQTVFNLHAIEGYTHVEIGQLLGISESTSRSQYMRARKQLAQWITSTANDKEKNYVRK